VARDLNRLVADVKEARAEFEARLDDMDAAKERYYETVRRLYKAGMPLREIAEAVGVSHQRVHQIVGEEPTRSRIKRVVAKRARAGGAALILVLGGAWAAASSGPQQPRAEALADLEDARRFLEM
jgi:predicted transcriptional regulator